MFVSSIKDKSTRICAALTAMIACTSMLAAAALPASSTYASPAAGTWAQQLGGSSVEVRGFSRTDANHLWASGSYGRVMRTTDGGQNWLVSYMPDPVMVMHGVKFVNNQV